MRRAALFAFGLAAGLACTFAISYGQAHDADTIAKSAPQKNPLFLNMTTGDLWRGWMGLHFAHSTLKMGHPVAVFLNLDAVKLAANDPDKFGKDAKDSMRRRMPQSIIADIIRDGGIVLMCEPCMAEFGLKLDDMVPGVQMGRPGYTQGFIFAENARTLSW